MQKSGVTLYYTFNKMADMVNCLIENTWPMSRKGSTHESEIKGRSMCQLSALGVKERKCGRPRCHSPLDMLYIVFHTTN